MVQITHTLVRDDETGKPVRIAADKFDKDTDGKKICHCPDKNCHAVLVHHKAYLQTFYDFETGEPFKLKVPAHFQRAQGSPPHDLSCTAVDAYTVYQSYARELGGLSQQHGRFVYNLNIMTDNYPAPVRARKILTPAFGGAAPVRENKSDAPKDGNGLAHDRIPEKRKLSEGLNHVQKLAGLLDHTEFDRHYRDSILLRDGRRNYTLADLFEDDALSLFRSAHARAKRNIGPVPVLLQFKPIVLPRYHSKKERILQGQAAPVRGADGHDYSVSVKLHCGSKEIFESLRKDMRQGKRSFLLYAENARVDLLEFAHKKKEIQSGTAKDRAVFVHVHVNMPQQITAWKPFNGQLNLEGAGMELPVHRKPAREFPEHLIG